MFWPEHDADRGRNALSKVIHHLRRSLPPGSVETQGDQVGIVREPLWCDVVEFEHALENGRAEDALALYRGDFLQGFHIPGAPDFDHWSDVERNRLRRMAVASAWQLASDAERAGDGSRATRFARQAVEWAPRDESGVRRLLTLLQSRGNRAEALEEFERFARVLRRDYGVDPSGPTLELIEAIRDGSLPYDLAAPLPRGPEPALPLSRPGNLGSSQAGEASTAEDVATPEDPPARSIPISRQPSRDSSSHRAWVVVVMAVGLIGLIALSLYAGGSFTIGRAPAPAASVLVTEFEDGTEEGLGGVVSEALRIDLAQSRSLKLIDRADIVETLELMGLESGVPISAEVGGEVAVRDGLEAVVGGAVVSAGSGYILTAAVREGEGGRTISSFRRSVTAPDQMIGVIDELSREIREALGEKLGTIQASPPLERVTTPSLEALKLYTRAVRAFNDFDDRAKAAGLLQRATAVDPGFAMAWRMLAVAVQGDPDQALRMEAARKAYDHRDRLTELERYAVEANYYSAVENNGERAVEALLRILDLDPENERALNNLGIRYLFMGEPEKAEEVFRRLAGTSGGSSTVYRNLIDTRLSLGRIEEASQALADFEQAYPDHQLLPALRIRTRFLAGAIDEATAEAQRIVDDPLWPSARRAAIWALLGRMSYWEGRFADGRTQLLEAERVGGRDDKVAAWARVLDSGYTAAWVGDVTWARAHIEAELDAGPEGVVLDRAMEERLVELLTLSSETGAGHVLPREFAGVSRVAVAHTRIQAGDTVGLRAEIEQLPLHRFQRVLLYERLGDTRRTIELYEGILNPGYTGWGISPHRLRALMRLGPLYEEVGDTRKAIDAYTTLSRLWAGGDRHGRAVAERFAARARALEAEPSSM
jgi:DNA-binding SARP family transcriptional activator